MAKGLAIKKRTQCKVFSNLLRVLVCFCNFASTKYRDYGNKDFFTQR